MRRAIGANSEFTSVKHETINRSSIAENLINWGESYTRDRNFGDAEKKFKDADAKLNGGKTANGTVIDPTDAKDFEILQCDWFMPLKDTSGTVSAPKPYFPPYISFDPFYKYLYDPDGIRIEKNKWSLKITDLHDLEAAKEYCYDLRGKGISEVYIMMDQYGGQINFLILVGNYANKAKAVSYKAVLEKKGVKSVLRDLNAEF